jgi:hypothetical protein
MTIQLFLQTLGAFGVISSFLYAAVQISRNTRQVRAGSYLQVTSSFANTWLNFAADAEMIDLILRGSDDFQALDRVEKARFRFASMGYLRHIENAYFLHRLKILKHGDWQGVVGDLNAFISRPGSRDAWSVIKHCSGEEFREYVQAMIERQIKSSPLKETGQS